MRTIAISLCDNDFGGTFQNLLETIYRVMVWHDFELEKEVVEKAIREGIKFHYMAFQLGDRVDETMKYLSKIKIYFDEEAEKRIQEDDHDGGSWYLELQTGRVYGY